MERPLCRTREKHPWIHNTSVTRVFAFIDLLFGENSRTASSYIIIILASMNSWNSLICIFEPATHYYVARRVFHVVYISIGFRWLFKVNRNTPRGGDTRVKQAKGHFWGSQSEKDPPGSNPTRVISWRVFYLREEEIFLPFFFSLFLFFYFLFFLVSQPLLSRTTPFASLASNRGNGGEERSKFVTWMIQMKQRYVRRK